MKFYTEYLLVIYFHLVFLVSFVIHCFLPWKLFKEKVSGQIVMIFTKNILSKANSWASSIFTKWELFFKTVYDIIHQLEPRLTFPSNTRKDGPWKMAKRQEERLLTEVSRKERHLTHECWQKVQLELIDCCFDHFRQKVSV